MNAITAHKDRLFFRACLFLSALTFLLSPHLIFAEESLSVSVTPPLFQLSIGPGEFWASSIKVVNNNAYDVAYYAEAVDFAAEGEDGKSKINPFFESSEEENNTFSLASWIDVSSEPTFIPKGTSREIPFSVRIPADAEPGGHYAAILVGTQPGGTSNSTGPAVRVSSFVSSLLFVRVKGDVVEKGRIREFTTAKSLYQKPEADFLLRFENTGNVHLHPQGDITIYNMWGKERGAVQINEDSNFGNVLPQSTRKFEFTWMNESDPFDIGRYSAVVTLAYGEEAKQNTTATAYFWVVPVVPVALALGVCVLFFASIFWFIRLYVRRALAVERAQYGTVGGGEEVRTASISALIEPIREGVVDLRDAAFGKKDAVSQPEPYVISAKKEVREISELATTGHRITLAQFVGKYHLFFMFIGVLVAAIWIGWWYVSHALVPQKEFEISERSANAEKMRVSDGGISDE